MSFLFKSKKQQQPASALPAATRNITSSDGPPASSIPTANGTRAAPAPREPEPARNSPQAKTPTPTASVNNSLSSLHAVDNTASPEPTKLRERSDSQLQVTQFLCVSLPSRSPSVAAQSRWTAPKVSRADADISTRMGAPCNHPHSAASPSLLTRGLNVASTSPPPAAPSRAMAPQSIPSHPRTELYSSWVVWSTGPL